VCESHVLVYGTYALFKTHETFKANFTLITFLFVIYSMSKTCITIMKGLNYGFPDIKMLAYTDEPKIILMFWSILTFYIYIVIPSIFFKCIV